MSSVKAIKNKLKTGNWISGLPFSRLPKIESVAFIKDEIAFVLNDERIIYIPLSWSKKLLKAKPRQRLNYKNNGIHVFWDEADEIIGIKNILFGKELFLWSLKAHPTFTGDEVAPRREFIESHAKYAKLDV